MDTDLYGAYPLDKHPDNISYWIKYITALHIKAANEESGDKSAKSLDK